MTNVIKSSDAKHYKSLDKVPEVLRLAAWVSSNNDDECLVNSNKIKDEINTRHNSYDPRYERNRRRNCHHKRPIDVKNAFNKVRDLYTVPWGNFDTRIVDATKSFFETAVSAGYTTKRELAVFLEIKIPDDLDYLANRAREKRVYVEGQRNLGRIRKIDERDNRKMAGDVSVNHPSRGLHVVGRAPR